MTHNEPPQPITYTDDNGKEKYLVNVVFPKGVGTGIPNKALVKIIYDIHREYIDDHLIGFRPPVAYADAVDKGQVIFAMVDDEVLGFAHYRKLKRDSAIRLYAVAVREEERGMGIGTALLRFLEQSDSPWVETEVRTTNEASYKFFKKNGYTTDDVEIQKKTYAVYKFMKPSPSGSKWTYNELTQDVTWKKRRNFFE